MSTLTLVAVGVNPEEVRACWRGAVPSSDVKEIADAASALKEGTLGEKLTALPGIPPSEWQSFLDAVMRVTAVLRTSRREPSRLGPAARNADH